LEPIFKEVFGVTHHQATEDIIAGRVPLGVDVYKILRKYGIDVERLIATIAGREAGFHGFFSGPINFDTIEGIVRAQAYTRPKPNTLSPDAITQAALRRSGDRDQSAVDQFWLYKEQVYRHVINSRAGVLADIACQNFMRRHLNKMSLEDYFVTEPQVFRKLPGLRNLLTNRLFEIQMMRLMDGPISYTARHFYIDSNSDFFARNDTGRYRQSRERCTLMPHHLHAAEPVGLTQDLFNDPSY
jgi:hypothetical protein